MVRSRPKRVHRRAASQSSPPPKPAPPAPPAPMPVNLTLWLGSQVMIVKLRTDGGDTAGYDADAKEFLVPAGTTVERCLEIGGEFIQRAMVEYGKVKGAKHEK